MADPARPTGVCSECDKPLYHRAAKTCSKKCRGVRGRRIKSQNAKAGRIGAYPPELKTLSLGDETLHEVAKEELRPVVREAITEDVLRAASKLVGLTPVMVDAIEEDLHSTDRLLRQRAYSLLAKYTLGNQSIAPQPDAPEAQPMQVVFALPRPGQDPVGNAQVQVETVELKECSECKEHKAESTFIDGSDRCADCHQKVLDAVASRFS